MPIKPAINTLQELRAGEVMDELAAAIHDVIGGVQQFRKKGTVTLTLTVAPLGTDHVSDAIYITAEVDSKVPQPAPPPSLFFVDANGNPSTTQDRQREIPLSVAGTQEKGAA